MRYEEFSCNGTKVKLRLTDLSDDMTAVNNGLITYTEFQKRNYINGKALRLPEIESLAATGKWEEFCGKVGTCYEVMPEAFKYYYKDIPQELRRDFVLSCYSHHGDSIPACRKAVRELEKKGISELPSAYRNQAAITVFRAGEEDICKAKYRLSWTIDRKIAQFFFSEFHGRHAAAIYKAKIRPCDVIAYMNDRKEQEVLQYRKVFDVVQIA